MIRAFKAAWIVLFAALTCAANEPEQPAAWYMIAAADGQRLGYASHEVSVTPGGREVVETQRLYLTEEGGEPTVLAARTVTTEDSDGRTLAIVSTSRSGRERSTLEARIAPGVAHVVRETRAGRWSGDVALPADVRFDGGDALLRAQAEGAPFALAFDNFNLDAMAVERVTLEGDGHGGVLRRRYEGGELRSVSRLTVRAGRVVEIAQPMFGAMIYVTASERAAAERRHPPYTVLANLMVRSPFRISEAAASGHMRYRFGFADDAAFALPQTGEQRARVDAGVVTVDICAACGPGLATDEASLAQARRSTPWMQSDDPRLLAIAAPIARMNVSDARKMELLLERARPYLAGIDYHGHYSALETLERRAGDCTEAAVLLAALGRAAGIPTRVASGVSYSRGRYHGLSNVFVPHSWTLAYVDGQWRSFDLALDAFDSTHIALTVGDGDARSIAAAGQLLSLLRWDGLAEVRARG